MRTNEGSAGQHDDRPDCERYSAIIDYGADDPGTINKQRALNNATPKRWLLAGFVATVIVLIPLVVLAPYAPLFTGIGMIAALLGLLFMLVVLWMGVERRRELRTMALLLTWIWVVPAAMIATVLIGQADQIFT